MGGVNTHKFRKKWTCKNRLASPWIRKFQQLSRRPWILVRGKQGGRNTGTRNHRLADGVVRFVARNSSLSLQGVTFVASALHTALPGFASLIDEILSCRTLLTRGFSKRSVSLMTIRCGFNVFSFSCLSRHYQTSVKKGC